MALAFHKKPTVDELNNKFDYHAPFGDQKDRYTQIRKRIKECAIECTALTPCSPEQTRGINSLHEAMMLFNAAIALNEKPPKEESQVWVILCRQSTEMKWGCSDTTEYHSKAEADAEIEKRKLENTGFEYMSFIKPPM